MRKVSFMDEKKLNQIAVKLSNPPKGILAADESTNTITKRFNLINTQSRPYSYSWGEIHSKIKILSNYLKKIISNGDRCILLSENRPEWLITDLAIMNASGVTVPLFTTYSENDYKYIINDCEPKVCIV